MATDYNGMDHTPQWDTSQVPNAMGNATFPIMDWEFLRDRIDYFMEHDAQGRRRAVAFTQKSLAQAAGLHDTAVRDIRKGRSKNPELRTIKAVAEALDVTLEELTRKQANIKDLQTVSRHTKAGEIIQGDNEDMYKLRHELTMALGTLPDTSLPILAEFMTFLRKLAPDQAVRPQKPGRM